MSVFKMNNSCGNKDPKSLVFAQLKIDIHRYLVSSRGGGAYMVMEHGEVILKSEIWEI